jgi:hypothetical protein
VPFLVEGTKLSATDVLIARTPFPSEARQVRRGSATASASCQPGESSPAPNPPQQTQTADPNPCPPWLLALRTPGRLLRPASRGVPKPQDLRRELDKIMEDLDLFWHQQFAAHKMTSLYDGAGPSPLFECAEQNCFYAPKFGADGAFLYNSEFVLDLWKRYGRVAVVGVMAHEFGHKAEFKAKRQVSRDLQRELLATQLAGAYIADLHRRGIVSGDRSFGASGTQGSRRSPCPQDDRDDDIRAIEAWLRSAGDPDLAIYFRGSWQHDVGKSVGMPDSYGSGTEQWNAFWDGYKNGIPPELFIPPRRGR